MSVFIYSIGIRFWGFLIWISSFFNDKAKLWIKGRKELIKQYQKAFKENYKPVYWFHCASLGEFEQGRPLIEKLKSQKPDVGILLTFFSPSGYEIRKNYSLADWVFYLPLDIQREIKSIISIVNPKMVFIVKYEFWHHFITELNHKEIPIISVSSIFKPSQIYFKWYGIFFRNILKKVTYIFVQNSDSQILLSSINVDSLLSGDTRFDRVKAICEQKKTLPIIEKFKSNQKLLVIGSSWVADLEIIAPVIESYLSENKLKLVIAPHEIDSPTLDKTQSLFHQKSILYSNAENENLESNKILIINNIGLLSSIYSYANFAYVGGAFGKGLHNILEPATFGMPIFFGPNFSKFKEAVDLVNLEGAFSIKNKKEFKIKFEKALFDTDFRKKTSLISANYIRDNVGATEIIFKKINQYF